MLLGLWLRVDSLLALSSHLCSLSLCGGHGRSGSWAWYACSLVVASIFIIPQTQSPPADNPRSIWVRVDVFGCLTGVSGLVLVNFAWNQAPAVGWNKPYVYVLLIVGLLCLGLFAQVEKRAKFPLVPLASMTSDVGFIFACVACGWAAFGIWVYFSWQFVEQLRGISPLLATAEFVPAAITGFAAALTTGFMFTRVPGSILMMISLVAFCIGPILLATAPVKQTYWAQMFVAIFIMPFGMYVALIALLYPKSLMKTGTCPSPPLHCCCPMPCHENIRVSQLVW